MVVGRRSFPFGFRPIFRGELLVSGRVIQYLPTFSNYHFKSLGARSNGSRCWDYQYDGIGIASGFLLHGLVSIYIYIYMHLIRYALYLEQFFYIIVMLYDFMFSFLLCHVIFFYQDTVWSYYVPLHSGKLT